MASTLEREAEIVRRAREGDVEAFEKLVGEHQHAVYRACRRYVDDGDAEDAAQETFIRLFTHGESLDPQRPVLPWLLAVARRLCIDRLRKSARFAEETPSTPEPADPTEDPERGAAAREQLVTLQAALGELPEGQREAMALFHFDELSYAQIAEVLAVPQGTVMTWIHRGRARLRQIVEGRRERTS